MLRKLVPLVVLSASLMVLAPAAQAAGKPTLAARGSFSPHDSGGGVASFSVSIYSKTTFKVGGWKEVDRLADRYRPTGVVLHVKGRKVKLNKVGEAMPEFIYGFFAPAKVPGLSYRSDLPAKVTFRNKVKRKTQTLRFTLEHSSS